MFNQKGFTLIELLVVVLIIGILAAIAIPQYQKAVAKSAFATLMPVMKAIMNAEDIYFLNNNTFTSNLNDLDINLPGKVSNDSNNKHSQIVFPWGKCVFGWYEISQQNFSCKHNNLQNVGFECYSGIRECFCIARTSDPNSNEYKFCDSLLYDNKNIKYYESGYCAGPCYLFSTIKI